MKAPKSVCVILVLILGFYSNAQEKIQDTLLHKSYDDLNTLFYYWLPKDTVTAKTIVNTYIAKARAEKDSIRMAKGYYYYAADFDAKKGLRYADTIIALTKHTDDKFHPAVGYLLKGYWYYHLEDYKKTMEHYLIGYKYAVERDNIKMLVEIRPTIAVLKSRVGDYKGALAIHKEHLNALENRPEYREMYSYSPNRGDIYKKMHLYAINNLANVYSRMGEIDSAGLYYKYGMRKSLEYKDSLHYYKMVSFCGIIKFHTNNYQDALDSLNKAIPRLEEGEGGLLILSYYYKGKSYQALHKEGKALSMFLKTDSLATKINAIMPELRVVYEKLATHYEFIQEKDSQIIYINKILDLDKTLLEEREIGGEIARKYDMPELLRQKETIIRNLENRHKKNAWYKWSLFFIIVLLVISLAYYYKKQRTYQKRFRELVNQNTPNEKLPRVRKQEKQDSGVPEEIFKNIQDGLEKFERKHQFTNPDISLKSLADDLNTNSTYLSRVINTTKDMNFSQYLHHIRIKHIVERLKKEEKLRQYAVEAIAQEAGYKTAQSFTKAFYKETGIYPSYFLRRLKTEVVD
ncbi:helix-turn-helix domain-containing protein [Sinomicrobium sp. M5D2P17]